MPEFHQRRLVRVIELAQIGYASWFFGNLYEAIVKVPDRIAHGERLVSFVSSGSPVLYFIPGVILIIASTLLLVTLGWRVRQARRALLAIAASVAFGVLVTGYLVPAVNVKLFLSGSSVSPGEQSHLLSEWHKLNWLRLITTASAWWIAARLKMRIVFEHLYDG